MKYFWQRPTRRKLFTSKALITAVKHYLFFFYSTVLLILAQAQNVSANWQFNFEINTQIS